MKKTLKEVVEFIKNNPASEMALSQRLNKEISRKKKFECFRCKTKFYPPEWFFYGLCDTCFNLFDEQKMNGRFSILGGEQIKYFENASEWMKENPYET